MATIGAVPIYDCSSSSCDGLLRRRRLRYPRGERYAASAVALASGSGGASGSGLRIA